MGVYHIISLKILGTGILLNLCPTHAREYEPPKGCFLAKLDKEPTGECEVCHPPENKTTS